VTCGSERVRYALVILAVTARPALATPADDAFKQGRELFKAGKFAEACTAFAESQRLDPSFGTNFNIAQCSEKVGKLATALAIYRDLAANDTNPTRKAAAADLAAALAPRVPSLQLQLEPRPTGLEVQLDGAPCPACAQGPFPVDVGPHTIVVRAPGFREATTTATAVESKATGVRVRLEPSTSTDAPVQPALAAPDPARSRSSRKRLGLYTTIGGSAVLVTGAVFGVLARGKWADAKDVCGGRTTCADPVDTARATELGDAARSSANLSTALVIAGGVIAAVGVVLYVTSPTESAVRVAGHASGDSAGVTLSGRF